MVYLTILGGRGRRIDEQVARDLRIHELLGDIFGKRNDDFLRSLYLEPLDNEDVAVFRLNVFRDLLKGEVLDAVAEFVERVNNAVKILEMEKDVYEEHKIGMHVDAALIYTEAVETAWSRLRGLPIESEGLAGFTRYLGEIAGSEKFRELRRRARAAAEARDQIKIRVWIEGDRIRVTREEHGEDLSALVDSLFSRFKGDGEGAEVKYVKTTGDTSHIHAAILRGAFKMYRTQYDILRRFSEDSPSFIDDGIANFAKEAEFYLIYVNYMRSLEQMGYRFAIPSFTDGGIYVRKFYNLLLAKRGFAVPNDIQTDGSRSIFVITGMNSGGKTTFATSFGQLAFLAKLGLPVPAVEAKIPFFSSIMTAYPVEEDVEERLSRLELDVARAKAIIERADSRSLVIANELFSSTTSDEGLLLTKLLFEELRKRGSYCLFVTFLHKAADLDGVISLVAQSSPDDPERPSYVIAPGRPPAEYMAARIAKRYRLTYEKIGEVVK
jgi:DNA mismatch repair protein MutS